MKKINTIAAIVWLDVLRKKDAYVLVILLFGLLVILTSLNIFGLGASAGFVMDIGLLTAWFFAWVLSISISSRELPQEETRGTIFSLLAKPITRAELLFGKWLGTWSVICAATLVFYVIVLFLSHMKGLPFDATVTIQGYLLHCAVIAIITSMGIMFSTRMNSDAAATMTYVTTATSFFVVPGVPEFLTKESGFTAWLLMFLYNLFPHFEVFDMRLRMVHRFGPVEWKYFLLAAAYGAALTISFMFIAWLAYRNKCFSRGSLAG